MSDPHPERYLVRVQRNNLTVHQQEAADYEDALRLQAQFEQVAHTVADIIKVHDPAATDLTTHTREIVEDIKNQATT